MDLGLQSEEYVKGEVLATTQRILKHQIDSGHIPTKCEYVQPKSDESELRGYVPSLMSVLCSFSEEFYSMQRMIENNFKLNSDIKPSPNAISLREEVENVKREMYTMEKELQNARSQLKNPDKRE